jgi:DNA-binding MurR/RpiR family transcriptional regulator
LHLYDHSLVHLRNCCAIASIMDAAPVPPATTDDLRSLALRIAQGTAPVTLGPTARRALGQILDLQGDPALLSITALAARIGVNPSTVTRLARALGYPGFGAFQKVLLSSSMTAPGAFYTRQAQAALAGAGHPSRAGAERLCRESQANIDRLLARFDPDTFDRAVAAICDARQVAVLGLRQMHALAGFLAYGLRMVRGQVSQIDAGTLGIAQALAVLGRGDVLIVASCAPWSRAAVQAATVAAEQGITVIALTDSADSPLVAPASVALFCPHETSYLSNALSTFVVHAECIVNACAAAQPDAARAALAEQDRMVSRLALDH